MIDTFDREELQALWDGQQGMCVSLFMPTHRAGPETEQDRIRFRNLLQRAQDCLMERGVRRPEARELLRPAFELLENDIYWRHQGDGLAVYLSSTLFRSYRLPLNLSELVLVSEDFHFKPVLPLLTGDGHFYVLALSQKQVRLLEGTRDTVNEIDLEQLPGSLAEALRYDDFERELQWHTRTAPAPHGERQAMFHGHGTENQVKERILRYCQILNRGIIEFLQEEGSPLVLAGVDYLLPIYRQANTYPHLVEGGLTGNPEATALRSCIARHGNWCSLSLPRPGNVPWPSITSLSAPD